MNLITFRYWFFWKRLMENYSKGKNVEEELERSNLPFRNLPENFLWMKVKGGSKMPNLLSHVTGLLSDQAVKIIVWTGAGVAIPKTISCAEIIKRQFNVPNQVTKLTYKTDEEYWEPKLDGLETLVVKRQIPVIHIMLSMDEIEDKTQLGYQSTGSKKFWQTEYTGSNPKGNQAHRSKKYKNKKDNNKR